jgi:hypothetical protein
MIFNNDDNGLSLYQYLKPLIGAQAAHECCGIVGYIGNKPIAGDVCI